MSSRSLPGCGQPVSFGSWFDTFSKRPFVTEDVLRLAGQIRERSKQVISFAADNGSIYLSGLHPFETSGRTYFRRPYRLRWETT